jgi:hypothetical protein
MVLAIQAEVQELQVQVDLQVQQELMVTLELLELVLYQIQAEHQDLTVLMELRV